MRIHQIRVLDKKMNSLKRKRPVSDFVRCIQAICVWMGVSFFSGLVAAFIGPGAAALVVSLFLGCCGLIVHLILWAIGIRLHWSYAGLVIGAISTVVLFAVNRNSSVESIMFLILFLFFTVLSSVIYPIASLFLESPTDDEAD